jgi:hypothetical protein
MTSHDVHDDPVLAALGELHALDVDTRRSERLATRCRAVLATERRATAPARANSAGWTRVTGLALLVAWCAIYTIEIARRGAAVWGL